MFDVAKKFSIAVDYIFLSIHIIKRMHPANFLRQFFLPLIFHSERAHWNILLKYLNAKIQNVDTWYGSLKFLKTSV